MNDAVRTMRAMRASSSDPASLTCASIPIPDPGPGELLVEVRGTAVTADELSWPESWPAIPCHDLSGVVAAAGDGADGWRPGDETSDAVKLSSSSGKFLRGVGEGDVLVVGLAGGQAVVEAAEEAAEQVALGGGVPVTGIAPAVVVAAGAG
jgi:NADPH:quinone reductase